MMAYPYRSGVWCRYQYKRRLTLLQLRRLRRHGLVLPTYRLWCWYLEQVGAMVRGETGRLLARSKQTVRPSTDRRRALWTRRVA